MRIYATPAAVVAMGVLWMWGGLDAAFRNALLVCVGVILVSILIGARSGRQTRRQLEENERRLRLLREKGLDALREDMAGADTKDAA